MSITNVSLFLATLFAGLMSGLFYAYSCSVMPGLGRLDDHQYISAMQNINRAIQNPVFFISFFGVLIALPIATYYQYTRPISSIFWLLLAATLIYYLGVFLVTVIGNIPLNNSLDKFDLTKATSGSSSNQRQLFETKWNNLNIIRTVCSLLSFVCSVVACLKYYKQQD